MDKENIYIRYFSIAYNSEMQSQIVDKNKIVTIFMSKILNGLKYLWRGIVDEESKNEKNKLFQRKVQIVTAFNLIAELIEIFYLDRNIEDNLEQA